MIDRYDSCDFSWEGTRPYSWPAYDQCDFDWSHMGLVVPLMVEAQRLFAPLILEPFKVSTLSGAERLYLPGITMAAVHALNATEAELLYVPNAGYAYSRRPPVLHEAGRLHRPRWVIQGIGSWLFLQRANPRRIYFLCVLRDADYLNPYPIEVPSFQARLRKKATDSSPGSYLSVVIPSPAAHAGVVAARTGGWITLSLGVELRGGQTLLAEIMQAQIRSFAIDQGGNSGSISITAYFPDDFIGGATIHLDADEITYYGLRHNGTQVVRTRINPFARPGDHLQSPAASFEIGFISMWANTQGQMMELNSGNS